jgi:two-component system sensor histidine kinase KdpD
LRTPLAVITGAATTLRDRLDAVSPAERHDLTVTICEEADRLERLVRNLLDMTRVESKSLQVKRQWISLDDVVVSALTRMEKSLTGRATTLDFADDLPLVRVDPILFEQLLVNLIDNATGGAP